MQFDGSINFIHTYKSITNHEGYFLETGNSAFRDCFYCLVNEAVFKSIFL